MLENTDYKVFKQRLLENRVNVSKCNKNAYNAIYGDIIKIVSGRKFMRGMLFTIVDEYIYHDKYNRPHTEYWVTANGQRVPKTSCIIVGHIKEE